MKSAARSHGVVHLSPDAHGWRLSGPEGTGPVAAASLVEAAGALPAGQAVAVSLPCSAVVLERMQLPTIELDELQGMVRLQLEKTLPFAPEEITTAFSILSRQETTSVILAVAVSLAQLEAVLGPLRAQGRVVTAIGVALEQLATAFPADRTSLVILREEEQCVLAIYEQGRLGWAQTIGHGGGDPTAAEISQALLGAEMAGAPGRFEQVWVETSCAALSEPISRALGRHVELFTLPVPTATGTWNLLPPAWRQERKRLRREAEWKKWLVVAGSIWVALALAAGVWLGWLNHRRHSLEGRARDLQPQLDQVMAQQTRWQTLAPAIEPNRFAVEILHQIVQSLPGGDVRLTNFEFAPNQFVVQGEAPNPSAAVDFGEQLKKNPALTGYKFEIGPPVLLPNDHAQFRISARR